VPVGMGEVVGKGGRKVNKVQVLCTHVCKCKNDTFRNYSKDGVGEMRENSGGNEFKYYIFDTF
jgi:hypothetical protein